MSKDVSNKNVEKELFENQEDKVNKEIEKIKKIKISKVGKIWEIRKRVLGGKKATHEATAILNPKNRKFFVSKAETKQVSINYCKDTLEDDKPAEGYEEEIKEQKKKVQAFLCKNSGSLGIQREKFESVVSKFKRSNKRIYDFLVRSGKQFQSVVFMFCQDLCSK